ncbi:MAG: CIA30 family protein [Bacteroidetes bacterium]|nr:CIA30 family protein [Bacteroidota bacterium]MBU2585223.1 CIA30 family protein [Bacteroidota bacterium]
MSHLNTNFLRILLFLALSYLGISPAIAQQSQSKDLCVTISGTQVKVATLQWVINPTDIKATLTVEKTLNDNTYGTNAIGWKSGHSLDNLLGSDKARFLFKDAMNNTVLEFDMDYMSKSNKFTSGYGTLGHTGGDGSLIRGNGANILSYNTSLNRNFNQYNYVLTNNSPATNTNYAPNPTYPNWIFDIVYEVTISKSAFGGAGVGSVLIPEMHHSPNKLGIDKKVTTVECRPTTSECDLKNFVTYTQGGWGSPDNSVPGNIRKTYFSQVFPSGLVVGGTKTLKLTSASKVRDFLPQGGIAAALDKNYTDPSTTSAGVFAGQVVALKLNVAFSDAGVLGVNGVKLGELVVTQGTLAGKTVYEVLNIANVLLGGGTSSYTITQLYEAATKINENFDDGKVNKGYLDCPPIVQKASIGDFVWYDTDMDGIQDAGEAGIQGVVVKLYDCNDNLKGTTTTDASGKYLFSNLTPGSYYVEFTLKAGHVFSPKDNSATTDDKDSDANTVTGKTECTVLSSGENDMTWDAGMFIPPVPKASIGDKVWLDENKNGIQDFGEVGVSGIVVKLFKCNDQFVAQTTTNGNGIYKFENIENGQYYVQFVLNSDYVFTQKDQGSDDSKDSDADRTTGKTICTTLDPGENDMTWDAGIYLKPASIGDKVWLDQNKNGVQDNGEPGIKDITVRLYDCDNNLKASSTTDINGIYSFTNLNPGKYYVQFVLPSGKQFTLQNQGSDDSKDSDAHEITGKTECTTLMPGENDNTWDAGMYNLSASLGDYVWIDMNKNGIQDSDEQGLANVTVKLFNGTGLVATTQTNPSGIYSFTNLEPGSYYLEFVKPSGFVFSPKDQGSDDSKDSDVNPSDGKTGTITLAAGQNDITWDAGLYPNKAITPILECVTKSTDHTWIAYFGYNNENSIPVKLPISRNKFSPAPENRGQVTEFQTGRVVKAFSVSFDGSNIEWQLTALDDVLRKASASSSSKSCQAFIGDKVWKDLNQNGVQDALEPGVANVTVELYDCANNLKGTTITNASGIYKFEYLEPGDYSVKFILPSGYAFSMNDQGSDDSKDSDADPSSGKTICTTLSEGEQDFTWDAGIYQLPPPPTTCAIGDRVWKDINKNGIQDNGEPGVQGVKVTLHNCDNSLVAQTTTNSNGYYLFLNQPASVSYYVKFELPNGYMFTTKDAGSNDALDSDANPDGKTDCFTPLPNSEDLTRDAGIYEVPPPPVCAIGDRVWNDINKNGIQDAGENGVAGVTVKLYDCSDILIETKVTDSNGYYLFQNKPAGSYYIKFEKPAGYSFSPKDQGTGPNADELDSDADPSTGKTICFTVSAGQDDLSRDAGIYLTPPPPTCALGDKVWNDKNRNGIQEGNESGVGSVTVKLLDSNGQEIGSTTTSSTGNYLFNGLLAGSYKLRFVLPTGFQFSPKDVPSSHDLNDSDADPVTGLTDLITLTPPNCDSNSTKWDAGIHLIPPPPTCAIGDRVWNDLDKDGIQDAGEPGVKDVDVTLIACSSSTAIKTVKTNEFGYYLFTDVLAGSYQIQFSKPSGYVFTLKDRGHDFIDSDADPSTGKTICFTIEPPNCDSNSTRWDAGIYLAPPPPPITCSIGDKVWNDVNGNGIQESGEPGVKDVTVKLLACSTATKLGETKTNSDGIYKFENLSAGSYRLEFVLPSGYSFSPANVGNDNYDSDVDPITGSTTCITLSPPNCDSSATKWDAGILRLKGSIGDLVWNDKNGNGIQDVGESGVSGILVKLFDCTGNEKSSTTTNSQGKYLFNDVMPGSYYVQFFAPSGFLFTAKDQGSDDSKDSDADPLTGKTTCFSLSAGENSLKWDAGLSECATGAKVCGIVFNDINGNGVKDAGEVGIANVVMKLWGTSANLIATTLTDAQGKYNFLNVSNGQYHVQEIDPSGYFSTTPNSQFITITGFDRCGIDFGDKSKPAPEPCDLTKYRTYSNTSWCLEPAKSLLISKFSAVFPSGMKLGGISSGFKADFTSATAVLAFLPQVGTAGAFNTNYNNPSTTSAGVFAGNLAALELNVQFNEAGFLGFSSTTKIKNLVVASGPMKDYKVHEVLNMAHKAIGGVSTPFSIAILNNVVESINANFNCDCSRGYLVCPKDPDEPGTGFDGGVESNANLADLLLQRLTKIEYGLTTKLLRNSKIPFTASYGLNVLLPPYGPMGSRPIETTPFDILGISNATSAYAVDYKLNLAKGDVRVASVFATTTPPPYIYEHTKAICDRLIDAELQSLTQLEIGGQYYFASLLYKQLQNETDYTIHFSVYEKGGSFIVDSRWLIADYVVPAGVTNIYNFQVWANNFNSSMYLVLEIVDQFKSRGNVEFLNNNSLPVSMVYVQKGKYLHDGSVELVINNSQAVNDNITLRIKSRAIQGGGKDEFVTSYSIPPGLSTIVLKSGIISDANIYIFTANGFKDEVFISGGAFTYLNGGSSAVDYFNTNSFMPQSVSDYPKNSLVLSGGVNAQGRLNDWVTLFRSLTANTAPYDLSDYNAIHLSLKGYGKAWLRIEQDGVKDFNFHSKQITLDGSEQTLTIPFSEFVQRDGFSTPLNPQLIRKISLMIDRKDNSGMSSFDVELKNIAFLGKSGSDESKVELTPTEFKLSQNYPNPFNPSTMIEYSIAKDEFVTLRVYDILGQEVATLVNEMKSPGRYSARFDASRLSSGVYIYRIQSESFTSVRKMILQK